ncbi:MAG: hypothetical protein FWD89_03145 [Firmicutes bacterium]|nr:hypothetical protein [Bacillota bacterium]MCL2771286.1 hypothetical protein [Bacillota bacterium]
MNLSSQTNQQTIELANGVEFAAVFGVESFVKDMIAEHRLPESGNTVMNDYSRIMRKTVMENKDTTVLM